MASEDRIRTITFLHSICWKLILKQNQKTHLTNGHTLKITLHIYVSKIIQIGEWIFSLNFGSIACEHSCTTYKRIWQIFVSGNILTGLVCGYSSNHDFDVKFDNQSSKCSAFWSFTIWNFGKKLSYVGTSAGQIKTVISCITNSYKYGIKEIKFGSGWDEYFEMGGLCTTSESTPHSK